jgi:hypothetical protein
MYSTSILKINNPTYLSQHLETSSDNKCMSGPLLPITARYISSSITNECDPGEYASSQRHGEEWTMCWQHEGMDYFCCHDEEFDIDAQPINISRVIMGNIALSECEKDSGLENIRDLVGDEEALLNWQVSCEFYLDGNGSSIEQIESMIAAVGAMVNQDPEQLNHGSEVSERVVSENIRSALRNIIP